LHSYNFGFGNCTKVLGNIAFFLDYFPKTLQSNITKEIQ